MRYIGKFDEAKREIMSFHDTNVIQSWLMENDIYSNNGVIKPGEEYFDTTEPIDDQLLERIRAISSVTDFYPMV